MRPYLLVICRGAWALSWPRGEGSGWEGAAAGPAPAPSHRRREPRMQAQPEVFPQCPAAPGCSSHRPGSPPRAAAVTVPGPRPGLLPVTPSSGPRCLAQGQWVKGDAVRAAGPSETTHPQPTPGSDHPSARPQRPENSRIQPLVLSAPSLHSDPPFGKPPPWALLGEGLGGRVVPSCLQLGLQAPSWRWGLWGSRGCPVRTLLLLL